MLDRVAPVGDPTLNPQRRLRRLLAAGAVIGGWLLSAGAAAQTAPLEYQVKAAYLVNFTRYIDWPADRAPAPGAPLTICVLGADPFGSALDSLAAGRLSGGHPVGVRRIGRPAEAIGCQLVFVSREEWRRRPSLLRQLALPGVVTVGESPEFGREGGVISFVLSNETVRFMVNLAAQERAGVRISSRVLALATDLLERAPR